MPGFTEDFYVRYYVGHTGKFGHEFLEFEFKPDGQVTIRVADRFEPAVATSFTSLLTPPSVFCSCGMQTTPTTSMIL